jgi:hypothetical protein
MVAIMQGKFELRAVKQGETVLGCEVEVASLVCCLIPAGKEACIAAVPLELDAEGNFDLGELPGYLNAIADAMGLALATAAQP